MARRDVETLDPRISQFSQVALCKAHPEASLVNSLTGQRSGLPVSVATVELSEKAPPIEGRSAVHSPARIGQRCRVQGAASVRGDGSKSLHHLVYGRGEALLLDTAAVETAPGAAQEGARKVRSIVAQEDHFSPEGPIAEVGE